MKRHFHITLAAMIWPGPIDGPHPFTLFKILTPILIIWIGILPATFVMALFAALTSLYFYEAVMLEGSSDLVNKWVARLPNRFEKALRYGTMSSLIPLVLLTGPFPLAISFRLLDYQKSKARLYLILGSFANALIWTGVVWGGGLTILTTVIGKISLL